MLAYDLLHAFAAQTNLQEQEEPKELDQAFDGTLIKEEPADDPPVPAESSLLINAAKTSEPLAPSDIRRILSSSSKRSKLSANVHYLTSSDSDDLSCSSPPTKVLAFEHGFVYIVSRSDHKIPKSLVDRGANGGIAGADVRVIDRSFRSVDIQGIDNHQLRDVSIGSVGGVVHTHCGPVIAIFHQYALYGKGSSIHAPVQLEYFKNTVDEKSRHAGGAQCIMSHDGQYIIPLAIHNGLARLPIRPYTDDEWDTLPHIIMTDEADWDPSVLDCAPEDVDIPQGTIARASTNAHANLFDPMGNYKDRVAVYMMALLTRDSRDTNAVTHFDMVLDSCVYHAAMASLNDDLAPPHGESPTVRPEGTGSVQVLTHTPDFDHLRPLFGWLPAQVIQQTFERTTQYARLPHGTLLRRAYRSPNPAFNVHRRSEDVACDFIFSNTPAVDNGSTAAVLFVGRDTTVSDVYGVKHDREFVSTLEDNIRDRGAPHRLISDKAQVEISQRVENLLRALFIKSWQSEPYQQQQNYAERYIQTLKRRVTTVMDRTGAPPETWLLCTQYVCFLMNHTYNKTIGSVPLQALNGSTVDISPLLRFHFWQPVYFYKEAGSFPSTTREGMGHFVGISEHVGPVMTFKVLTAGTSKVIYRSILRPATPADPNLRAAPLGGEGDSVEDDADDDDDANISDVSKGSAPVTTTSEVDPEILTDVGELVGRSFLLDEQDDGTRFRATIVKCVEDLEAATNENPTRVKFICAVGPEKAEEIFTYNQVLDYLSRDDGEVVWKFKKISSHQGPLKPDHPDYKGSTYNVTVEWENGEVTNEPLSVIAADTPVTCAIYARENGLLDTPGWKRFKRIARREKKLLRMANQAKLRSFRHGEKYKYGFVLARNYEHAMDLDRRNGNTRYADAIATEFKQVNEYQTFEDMGHATKTRPPEGYKRIRVHLVFDIKHDGRHKARLVADGHLTDVPLESVYSGVVTLRGFRLVLFLGELNDLETWSTDVGNAYLEAYTSEKVYIIAGKEFGEREGHILLIKKALYGLRSSGARWHDRLAEVLREMSFAPCRAEPDIWMRPSKDATKYEYVAVYVDDLALALEKPQEFLDTLTGKYNFKLKGSGPISFHLGMDFGRDEDGTLYFTSKRYVEKILSNYERLFGEPPKRVFHSPLEKGDHPELDDSELLQEEDIKTYQSLIGSLQWAVTIGRFDIMTAVVTLSSFRAAPRKGHLERAKRIFGYLARMKTAAIRVRTEEPDYSDLPYREYDWAKSVYGEVREDIPADAPRPLGKFVTTTHFVDANLMHCAATGRAMTGILHLVNKTPMDWFCKKQGTVETATYGSEFNAARACVEQIMDIRMTLRYLGVPIRDRSYVFGDNESMINSATQIHSKLHKRHTMLSYHRVREAVAAGIVHITHVPGSANPADILSKHWGYADVWHLLRPLLFWKFDTMDA